MGLGERADAAIAAYRADYTTRGWAMNSLFDGIADAAGRPAGRGRAAGGRHLEGRADRAADPRALRPRRAFRGDRRAPASTASAPTKADVLAHALAQLQPLPERVLMVGDRSHDVEGAAAHGIDTVVVGWGYGAGRLRPTAAASRAVPRTSRRVAELREVLGV